SEHGVNQADFSSRRSITIRGECFGRALRLPLEPVWSRTLAPLLLAEGPYDQGHGAAPLVIEGGAVLSRLPVTIRQANRMTQGVNLPLALRHSRLHLRFVLDGPLQRLGAFGVGQKGIRIGIDQNAAGLAVYQAAKHFLQRV